MNLLEFVVRVRAFETVYEASDRTLGTKVVIKVPHATMVRDAQFSERFAREIRSLVQLSHPHIVKVIDAGIDVGAPYAVMQFLAGGSLEDHLSLNNSQPAEVSRWLEDVCKALDFVHDQNYLHRDIKPGNILFDDYGNVYLSDFGIAKALAAAATERLATLTATGMVLGTPEYMAPELILGNWVDGRADQYSLAVTIYEMLSGRRPFEGTNTTAIMVAASTQPPTPLKNYASHLSGLVCLVVNKALAKNPQDRYSNCLAFAQAFKVATVAGAAPHPVNADSVKLSCPICGRSLRVPASFAGREVACPNCKSRLSIANDRSALVSLEARSRVATVVPQATNAPPVTAILARPGAVTAPEPVGQSRWQQLHKSRRMIIIATGLLASMLVLIFVLLAISVSSSNKLSDPQTSTDLASSSSGSNKAAANQGREVAANGLAPQFTVAGEKSGKGIAGKTLQSAETGNTTIRKVPNNAEPGTDTRSRWISATYDATFDLVDEGMWNQKDNKTGHIDHRAFKETARTENSVELFSPARKEEFRLLSNRMESKGNGKWNWVASGYWEAEGALAESDARRKASKDVTPDSGDVLPSRWLNESYGGSIYYIKDKQWAEADRTGKINSYLIKTDRSPQYVELFNLKLKQTYRLSSKTIETLEGTEWKWIANGHWSTTQSNSDGDVLYLADLKEVSFEVLVYGGKSEIGKGTIDDGGHEKIISLAGKPSPKGIAAHPKPRGKSMVAYDLRKHKYKYFEASVGVDDARNSPGNPQQGYRFSSLTFEVWGDGGMLWQSQSFVPGGQPQTCKVELPDISRLELIVRCQGSADYAWAVWCEPRLLNDPSGN